MNNMKRTLFLLLCLCSCCIYAQQPEMTQLCELIRLWADDPGKDSELFVYFPEKKDSRSPAVLIIPGGGYGGIAIDHEGHKMAKWLSGEGFVAVVLKYRLPGGVHTIPLEDAEQAIHTIRKNASSWKVDVSKVGVIGSSAGGHLAASLSTLAADANRPNFAILYYPVISFDNMTTHGGSKNNLLGSEVNNQALVNRYSLEKQVDKKTPPTLLLLSDDDKVVVPANSILYYTALKKAEIPAAMYIFPSGGHGWGFNDTYLYHKEMRALTEKWLLSIGM